MESVISPQLLQKGDAVGIIAPARRIGNEELIPFTRFLLNAGFKVVSGRNLYGTNHQLSGTVAERLSDIHQMFTDPSVKAIFSARGGYGTAQLLPGVDWEVVRDNPKWLVGFSDITALHSAVGKFMETIHGVMPYSLMMKEPQDGASVESLLNLLAGKEVHYHPDDHPLNVQGSAEGALTGGNLSVLYSLAGTQYEPEYEGKILFLEDVDEYMYHIDRMILNFEMRDIFRKVAGMVIGDFSDMHDNSVSYGSGPLEIIAERAQKYNVPTLFGFPAGHKKINFPLIFGRVSTLTVQREENSLLMNQS